VAAPSRVFAAELGPVYPAARELALSMDLEADAEYITDRMMRIVFPDRSEDDAFRLLLSRNAYDNLETMWRIIAGRDELEASPPFGAVAFSDTAAQIGVPLSQFERIYRVGEGLITSRWYSAAVAYSEKHDVPLTELIGAPVMIVHAYVDGQISALLSRYESTQAEHQRTREQLQVSILRQALDGTQVLDDGEIESALGITLAGEHIAIAVRSGRSPSETGLTWQVRPRDEPVVVLEYRYGVNLWLLWLCHERPGDERRITQLKDILERTGLRCAIGDAGSGQAGLASTGRDALDAARLQDMLGVEAPDVVTFDELRLETLLLADPERARRFVRDELRGLDRADVRTARLRETARIWLMSGSNVHTASRQGLHEHTVRNRLAQIDELVGRSITKRRTEMLVALRLRLLLDHDAEV
jgi:hypothetical protein